MQLPAEGFSSSLVFPRCSGPGCTVGHLNTTMFFVDFIRCTENICKLYFLMNYNYFQHRRCDLYTSDAVSAWHSGNNCTGFSSWTDKDTWWKIYRVKITASSSEKQGRIADMNWLRLSETWYCWIYMWVSPHSMQVRRNLPLKFCWSALWQHFGSFREGTGRQKTNDGCLVCLSCLHFASVC